jgi:hypothetical protein
MSGRQAPAALAAAAQQRTEEAKKRTRQAMKRLRTAGVPVTFRAVALEAGVSRDFLYRNEEMRALVNNSRSMASSNAMPARANDSNVLRLVRERCAAQLAASRAEIAELSRRLEAAHTEIHRLKRDLRRRQPRS